MSNNVQHPQHYNAHPAGIECIEIIRHYVCDIANAIKYLWRAGLKPEMGISDRDKEIEDLEKSLFYIDDYRRNCADETCVEVAKGDMRYFVRKATGHSVREICDGYHRDIAKALELLLMVGLVQASGIARVKHWEQYLASATKCIQHCIADLQAEAVSNDCADIRQYIGKLIVLNYDRESRLAFVEGIEKSSSDKEYADFCSIGGSSWGLRMDSGFTFRPATDLDINRAVIARCKDVAESDGYKF